ncbi:MAG: exodeoxyribonuclease VII small subunit [Chloroflexota bacterium]
MNDDTSTIVDFEGAFGNLQEAIGQLERGGLSLEAAIRTFESGMAQANRCAEILEAAELRVTRVLESSSIDLDEPAF